jgi:anaerobic magnesium-protoporphyrin IX monomethyl ester cyclase
MMFRGTYRSEFYRAVRDLLHERVCLQRRASTTACSSPDRTMAELDRRWADLIAREGWYRQHPRPPEHGLPQRSGGPARLFGPPAAEEPL